MLYILNVILPQKRNFKNAITKIYGIGRIRAVKLASLLGLHPFTKIEIVTQRKLNRLGALIERAFLTDFELKRKISLNISALIKLRTIRGFCHKYGLPTRGQRTHTNASTARKLHKKISLVDNNNNNNRKRELNNKNMKKLKLKNKNKKK